jgi:hypothetical protein
MNIINIITQQPITAITITYNNKSLQQSLIEHVLNIPKHQNL